MPIAYLDVPAGADFEAKKHMMQALYEALRDAYPFPDDHRIFLREWPIDTVSQNGLLGSEPARPVFLIHGPEGVDVNAKRDMLKALNTAVEDVYHLPDFMVFIHEHPLEHVAHQGNLLADSAQRVEAQSEVYPSSP